MPTDSAARVQLRRARLDDASAIARLHIASWRAAYRSALPAEYLASLNEAQRAEQWRERLSVPTTEVLLAQRDESIVGFCAHGPGGPGMRDLPGAWEIYGLHVAPDLRGGGIGSILFQAAADRAVETRARWLTLWVVKTNDPARRFYESKHMLVDGVEKRRELGPGAELHEVRYKRSLA